MNAAYSRAEKNSRGVCHANGSTLSRERRGANGRKSATDAPLLGCSGVLGR